jgi:hypothetical protein
MSSINCGAPVVDSSLFRTRTAAPAHFQVDSCHAHFFTSAQDNVFVTLVVSVQYQVGAPHLFAVQYAGSDRFTQPAPALPHATSAAKTLEHE